MSNRKYVDIEKAIYLYRDLGWTTTKTSKKVGCSVQTLITRLRENNISIRTNTDYKAKVDFNVIKNEYESGMSTTEIAKKHNMSSVSIWERLKKNGVKLRDRKKEADKKTRKIPLSEHQKICERYKNGENAAEIARDMGRGKVTIVSILHANGIHPGRTTGPRVKHLWKGGITELHNRIRHCEKGRHWIRDCMKRDDYTCCITGERGKKLHVHHKKRFSTIYEEFLLKNRHLDPIIHCNELFDLAQSYEEFWDVDNGITICEEIHKLIHGEVKLAVKEGNP
jgi:hypothetical protein